MQMPFQISWVLNFQLLASRSPMPPLEHLAMTVSSWSLIRWVARRPWRPPTNSSLPPEQLLALPLRQAQRQQPLPLQEPQVRQQEPQALLEQPAQQVPQVQLVRPPPREERAPR